ncbi:hypothetical protein DL96DRAFT_1612885 [Flagelloscypha sp. PMI_526]|nr:hypothetical protein DL96DRAFT_1612885 [Flagelloscypha sp. PMI_526]
MLGPKVASHVTRAASTTLHGSQTTLRNVWHSNNSNLGWNDRFFDSNGYNYRSNRSSSTFHQAGRAVTQANTGLESSSADLDDQDFEPATTPHCIFFFSAPSLRSRGHSRRDLSLSKILLKRCNHAFASSSTIHDSHPVPAPPGSPAIFSTSTIDNAAAPQSVAEPIHAVPAAASPPPSQFLARLTAPEIFVSSLAAQSEVRQFLEQCPNPTVEEFNAALLALSQTLYNAMVDQSLHPTTETYLSIIHCLLRRDDEVCRLVASHNVRSKRHTVDTSTLAREQTQIRAVLKETNFASAFSLFQAVLTSGGGPTIPVEIFEMLMRSCAHHNDADALIQVYSQFEALQFIPTPLMFRYMIQTMAAANRPDTVAQLFGQFQDACQQGKLNVTREGEKLSQDSSFAIMQVYNQAIEGYFRMDKVDKAIDLFGTMMHENARADFALNEVPTPSSSTCTCVIAGWIHKNDIANAEKWFSMLLQQPRPGSHPLQASVDIPRPDRIAWSLMIDALAKLSAAEEGPHVDTASDELPWAIAKLVEYTRVWFSPDFLDQETFRPKITDVTTFVTAVHTTLSRYQEVFRMREMLPEGWEQELMKVQELCNAMVELTASSELLPQYSASQSAWALRTSVGTVISASQMLHRLAPSVEARHNVQVQTFTLLDTYLANIAERDPQTQALMIEQGTKALKFIVVQLGSELGLPKLLRASAMATRFGSKDLDATIGRYAIQVFRDNAPLDLPARTTEADKVKVLQWLAADCYSRDRDSAASVTSVPSSPAIVSDTASVASSAPSLESFGGSEATEETAPDLQPNVSASTNPVAGSMTSVLIDMARHGHTSLSETPRTLKSYIFRAVTMERGGDAEETFTFMDALGFKLNRIEVGLLPASSSSQTVSTRGVVGEGFNSPVHSPSATSPASPVVEHASDSVETTQGSQTSIPIHVPSNISIDYKVTQQIGARLAALYVSRSQDNKVDLDWRDTYNFFLQNFELGRSPNIDTLAKLVEVLGRWGGLSEARVLYSLGQDVLNGPMSNKGNAQTQAWWTLENAMIVSHAYADDIESAHVHRLRIMEQGMSPNADAYASLILKVQDTTDDTSNAMALFAEARSRNVKMNTYLYNNIISKLAKARKADLAVELFQQMRAESLVPSSITYGTVIGACVRVGDVHSAETLFAEMTSRKNFKPRVPPYNHMMQLYTSIRPDRERALFFYDQMKQAGVRPSSHTYKLLMDAYGSCEPYDPAAMQQVFLELLDPSTPAAHGGHINSMITAYGVKMHNLEKAREIFATAAQYIPARDAVVYEAMFDALRAHGKVEEVESHIEAMNSEGVHMTAYIANVLIGLYSDAGRLDKARELFESMQDPPSSVAAVGNHAPHDPSSTEALDVMAPVYREPSTWEAMMVAQAKSGDLAAANDLLARMQQRQYPPQVYYKLSNLLQQYAGPLPSVEP